MSFLKLIPLTSTLLTCGAPEHPEETHADTDTVRTRPVTRKCLSFPVCVWTQAHHNVPLIPETPHTVYVLQSRKVIKLHALTVTYVTVSHKWQMWKPIKLSVVNRVCRQKTRIDFLLCWSAFVFQKPCCCLWACCYDNHHLIPVVCRKAERYGWKLANCFMHVL